MCKAIMATESTSFMQFDYCNLCKISHTKRKKHVYSKRHQEILQNILKKFEKKIQDGRMCIDNPGVEALGWENGAMFWCYFCELEISKHRVEPDCTVKHGGLILHLASDDHAKKTGEFFWKNIIDKKKKAKYILSKEDAERFSNKADTAVTVYRQRVKTQLTQIASKIRSQVAQRNQVTNRPSVRMQAPWTQTSTKQISQHSVPGNVTPRMSSSHGNSHAVGVPGKKTVSAEAVGLTSIVAHSDKLSEVEDRKEGEGNVFTGATAPWMMEEDEDTGSGEIGPSVPEYNKHLEREKKKKLPANRVGAKFDHKSQTSASWLPSFGGVWHQGRRLNSKIQFERRTGGKAMLARPDTSQLPRQPETVIPYKRKKRESETNTSTGIQLISSPLVEQADPYTGHQYHDSVARVIPVSSSFVQLPGVSFPVSAAADGGGTSSADQWEQEAETVKVTPRVSRTETLAFDNVNSRVEIRSKDEGPYQGGKDVQVSNTAHDSIQRTLVSNQTCSHDLQLSVGSSSVSLFPVSVKNQPVGRASDDKPPIKRGPSPADLVPYKRKKRPVRVTEPSKTMHSDVGHMFTQACDHAFTHQTQGSQQGYSGYKNTNLPPPSVRPMTPPPHRHYMTPYGGTNTQSYPGHSVNNGYAYRHQVVRGGNFHSNMPPVQPGLQHNGTLPHSSHTSLHQIYMSARLPVQAPTAVGSSAPNTSYGGLQHTFVRPTAQAILQGSSAPSTSQGNGMNLFQSISAAVRLPH
ncbi:uncharacterized protein LOC124286122 isoform X2 [Haliotis rubra]|uniref:uncharacterized protein LOC124286122 isoform X2 n=1 Tax=Haliotis rubra TaxID=36100 RepID=UPI001EE60233|nr:uncharacterized protein LOC124286122 isoform X2 [Haliotis rubra]